MRFMLASPSAYQFDEAFLSHLKKLLPKAEIEQTTDPVAAVKDAVAVYTDVWASMGQEAEREVRQVAFEPYRVDETLMAFCPDAVFMHCLPAFHDANTTVGAEMIEATGMTDGLEVTNEVFESEASIVFDQAENRLHAQKAVMALTM